MARYDLHPDGNNFLLDVQANQLDDLNMRIVVPMGLPHDEPLPARRLNPAFEIEGRHYVMVTQFASAVRASGLDEPGGSLEHHHNRIVAALDMLFQEF